MHASWQFGWIKAFILHQSFNRRDEITMRVSLTNIAVDANLMHCFNQSIAVINREDQYFCLWQASEDLPSSLKTIQFRHAEIQDSHVGFELVCLINCLLAVTRLRYYAPIPVLFDY